jgi:GTP-binding protein
MRDRVTVTIESGKGGDGIIAFDKRKKADGGNGGKGGDVYIVGDRNSFDFAKFSNKQLFKAENGERGLKFKKTGKDGEDLYIKVPLVTKVYNGDESEIITIAKANIPVKLLEGGSGGLGNFSLRKEGWDGKMSRTKGGDGQKKVLKLELNLKAHAIFLGYPNAGKSSIVNALTNANYKVDSYEFTTLEPQLAVMDRYVIMDLPGLIEGTYKGKGLGKEFLKHTRYSELLVHCISLENDDLKNSYLKMRDEFKNLDEGLYSIPEFVVFTKGDIYSKDELTNIEKELRKDFEDFIVVSVYKEEDMKKLKEELKKRLGSISNTTV